MICHRTTSIYKRIGCATNGVKAWPVGAESTTTAWDGESLWIHEGTPCLSLTAILLSTLAQLMVPALVDDDQMIILLCLYGSMGVLSSEASEFHTIPTGCKMTPEWRMGVWKEEG